MIRCDVDGCRYYRFEQLPNQQVDHAVFTRLGGASAGPYAALNLGGTVGDKPEAVLENHQRLFQVFGRPYESRFDVWQVHGTTMVYSDQPRPRDQKHRPADGIFTDNPDVTLIMRFADCVPLVFFDPTHHVVGLVHAGWQGTAQKIGELAVNYMRERFNSDPAALFAGIGPSICGSCYQTGEEVRARFLQAYGADALDFFTEREGSLYLDLWRANAYCLQRAGVQQLEQCGLCTAEDLDQWYSYRKEKGITGRFAVVIGLKHAAQ
ncbi:MAG: peptidoglycan editing factor PgeF [Anaerolineaceae bacterium]|jgi:YfiH family protein